MLFAILLTVITFLCVIFRQHWFLDFINYTLPCMLKIEIFKRVRPDQQRESNQLAFACAKPMSEIPSPPKHWFWGHAKLLKDNFKFLHKLNSQLQKDYGNIVLMQVPGLPNIVWIYDPNDSSEMYRNDGKMPINPGSDTMEYYRKYTRKDLFPCAGVISQGEEWHKNRSAWLLRPKTALYYIEEIEDIAVELRNVFEEKKGEDSEVNVNQLLRLWAFESICCIFISRRMNSLSPNPEESSDGRKMSEAVSIIFEKNIELLFGPPIWKYFPTLVPAFKQYDEAWQTLVNISKPYADAAIQEADVDNDADQSILARVFKRNENNLPLCRTMALDAMVGGIDSTASTATFVLYHLATNLTKQQVLYEEICDIVGANDETINETKLSKMLYLKACVQESQRMLPVTMGTMRLTQNDMVLSGYQIPKGTNVIRNGQVMQNDPKNFKNPEEFLPERWIRNSPSKDSHHPHAFLPFSHGTRMCPGKKFALLEIHILIIKLLQKYRLEYSGETVGIKTDLLSKPDRDVLIKLKSR